jgi:hypothetical protein
MIADEGIQQRYEVLYEVLVSLLGRRGGTVAGADRDLFSVQIMSAVVVWKTSKPIAAAIRHPTAHHPNADRIP